METKSSFVIFMRRTHIRIIVGLLIVGICTLGVWYLYHYKSPFPCMFYQVTGLYCPGCGTGRSAFDLIHLNIVEAMSHNIFFVIVFPFITYYMIKVYLEYLFQRKILPFFKISYRAGVILTVGIVFYWIARNIPTEPFLVLAP